MSHEISYVRIQSVFKLRSYDMGISKCQVTHLFPGQTTFHIYYDDLRNLKNYAFLKKKKIKIKEDVHVVSAFYTRSCFFFLDVRAVLAPPEKYYKKNRSFF